MTLSPANDPIAIKDFESVSHTDYAKLRNLILSDRFFGSRSQNRCNSISNIARAFDELLIRMMYSRSLRLLRREIYYLVVIRNLGLSIFLHRSSLVFPCAPIVIPSTSFFRLLIITDFACSIHPVTRSACLFDLHSFFAIFAHLISCQMELSQRLRSFAFVCGVSLI